MQKRLLQLHVENFRSLRRITIPLGPLNVMVGPNGAGKTNVLDVFRFLADIIRTDLEPALNRRGGYDGLAFRGGDRLPASIRVTLQATWTTHSSPGAPDEYELRIERRRRGEKVSLSRQESFRFKRTGGRGRRITISGERAEVVDEKRGDREPEKRSIGLQRFSSGLSTLPRLSDDSGGNEVATLARSLASFRVFDVDVAAARKPQRVPGMSDLAMKEPYAIADDAADLASFLWSLKRDDETAWRRLQSDAQTVLPNLEGIDFVFPSGPGREVIVVLNESGLRVPTPLADASFGTIRLLSLLALLYDPAPPELTCIEEIDHGLHPQALELLIARVREASARTQFLIATHSPALANRLRPEEMIVCERDEDGASRIPALSQREIEDIVEASEDLPLGELWFSGALGGDL